MVNTFAIVTIGVTLIGVALSLTRFFGPFRAAEELGRSGAWFDREEDRPFEERRDAGENDPPIPFRPLRPRP
jgi:hypothetical protein